MPVNDVLVTGGTGVLGRAVVTELLARGHSVRVLSRHAGAQVPGTKASDRVRLFTGDLAAGTGLAEAVAGADTVVHCASDPRRYREVDVPGTRRLIETAAATRPHLVYISIVGCDRIPYGYYRTKTESERLIAESGLPWSVLRATQFHELVLTIAHAVSRLPVVLLPRGLRDQPVDVRDVAPRLVDLVESGPRGRAPDLGGPEVLTAEDIVRALAKTRGRRARIVTFPLAGKVYAGLRAGHHLVTEGETGTRTFADHLAEHVHGGRVDLPYRLR